MSKAVVKLYDYKALLRLALLDVQRRLAVKTVKAKVQYICGLDAKGKPFLRIDLRPMGLSRKRNR